MNRPSIALSLTSISALIGGMFAPPMGKKLPTHIYSGSGSGRRTSGMFAPPMGKKLPTHIYSGSGSGRRTKGKRHRSLTERFNRQKAKAKHA